MTMLSYNHSENICDGRLPPLSVSQVLTDLFKFSRRTIWQHTKTFGSNFIHSVSTQNFI